MTSYMNIMNNRESMNLQMQLKQKMHTIAQLRGKDYQRRTYAVEMANFIKQQGRYIDHIMQENKSATIASNEERLMFEKFAALKQELPEYFFREPRSAAECYGKIMDALDVLLEDRDLLSSWEFDLDRSIARYEMQSNN